MRLQYFVSMKLIFINFLMVFQLCCKTFGLYIHIESVDSNANPIIGNVTICVKDHSEISGNFHIFKSMNDAWVCLLYLQCFV